jgi:membrane-bound lytic murein transglycosylase B
MSLLKHTLRLAAVTLALPALAQTAVPEFTRCMEGLQGAARAAGVQEATYTQLTQGLVPDMSVIEKLDYQPEFHGDQTSSGW